MMKKSDLILDPNNDFLLKNSRFNTLNLMREKANIAPAIWNEFKELDWATIETITEESRLAYNAALKVTREYRKSQFENIKTSHTEFNPKIKLIYCGETRWLDISDPEFEAIKKLLTR